MRSTSIDRVKSIVEPRLEQPTLPLSLTAHPALRGLRVDCGDTNGNRFLLVHHATPLRYMNLEFWSPFADAVCHGGARADDTLHVYGDGSAIEFAVLGGDGRPAPLCANGLLYAGTRLCQLWRRSCVEFIAGAVQVRVEVSGAGARAVVPPVRRLSVPSIDVWPLATRPVAVDVAEPHAVSFPNPEEPLDLFAFETLGDTVCSAAPDGINWNLCEVGSCDLWLRTFERGVRRMTASCGTGAIASLYAARETGRWSKSEAVVRSLGGAHHVGVSREGAWVSARPVHREEHTVEAFLEQLL